MLHMMWIEWVVVAHKAAAGLASEYVCGSANRERSKRSRTVETSHSVKNAVFITLYFGVSAPDGAVPDPRRWWVGCVQIGYKY
jgi:hypothetical protein